MHLLLEMHNLGEQGSRFLKTFPGKTPPVSCPATQPSVGCARLAGLVDTVWVVLGAEGFGFDSCGKMG